MKINPFRSPDFSQLLRILRREKPERATLFEFIADVGVMLGEKQIEDNDRDAAMYQYMRCFFENGYDFACLPTWITRFLEFHRGDRTHGESISQNEGGVITDEATFAAYRWPDAEAADYEMIGRWEKWLPDGAKFILMCPGGVLENLTDLVGFENLCYMLADEPDLVHAITEQIATRLMTFYERQLAFDSVGACMVNDDWGFKTSTILSHEQMRTYIIPWHRKIVDLIHSAGRPAILHSCGNLGPLWEDLIEDIGFDGKHSYEDGIFPVEEAWTRYHERIAILGGIDMDFLCRKTPAEIRRRVEDLINLTDGGSGYAVGSGNSIARYVPRENFQALRDAALNHS